MKYTVERVFYNIKHECLGWSYQNFDDALKDLLNKMKEEIGEEYRNLKFVMNLPLYNEFSIACQMSCKDSGTYKDILIMPDPTLYIGDSQSPYGIVRLVYEEQEIKHDPYCNLYCDSDVKATYELFSLGLDRGHGFQKVPHIDHVKFNGPATIVFWKDGTKTVVKYDGKGRKDKRLAVLYAFIRKIYGEGKPYHNILNEIEEAVK